MDFAQIRVLIELGFMMVCLVYIQISKNRRVSVRNWNGKIWIDIREFYVKDGKTLPGKKGNFFVFNCLSCEWFLLLSSFTITHLLDLLNLKMLDKDLHFLQKSLN